MKFKNHFLISMPHMVDVFFSKSIIYLCEHEPDGAMGVIINKNLAVKRPGNGISSMKLFKVIGKIAKRDFSEDELIKL